jgi:hypothetical protein
VVQRALAVLAEREREERACSRGLRCLARDAIEYSTGVSRASGTSTLSTAAASGRAGRRRSARGSTNGRAARRSPTSRRS